MSETQKTEQNLEYHISSQYMKDLSVENPNSPSILFIIQQEQVPNLSIKSMINVEKLNSNSFEVILDIKVTSNIKHKEKEMTCFILEIKYAALTTFSSNIEDIDRNTLERILAIDVPNTIWPSIRFIILENIRQSGYQIMLPNRINFEENYLNSKIEQANKNSV